MDVQSPKHLERLRGQPEIKAVLLRSWLAPDANEARFERVPKNALYWPPLESFNARFLAAGRAEDFCEPMSIYGRPCWLLSVALHPSPKAAYAICAASSEGASLETLRALLLSVSDDYWHGSYFFK